MGLPKPVVGCILIILYRIHVIYTYKRNHKIWASYFPPRQVDFRVTRLDGRMASDSYVKHWGSFVHTNIYTLWYLFLPMQEMLCEAPVEAALEIPIQMGPKWKPWELYTHTHTHPHTHILLFPTDMEVFMNPPIWEGFTNVNLWVTCEKWQFLVIYQFVCMQWQMQ